MDGISRDGSCDGTKVSKFRGFESSSVSSFVVEGTIDGTMIAGAMAEEVLAAFVDTSIGTLYHLK